MITYNISLNEVNAHIFDVCMTIPLPKEPQTVLTLKLPAWIPGSYMIRDFARHIINLRGMSGKEPTQLTQKDKHTWVVEIKDKVEPLVISYQVYAFDLSVRGCFLDAQRGFINPAAMCLTVSGQEKESCALIINPSEYSQTQNWQLATALKAKQVDAFGFGDYYADNYAHLIDCPIELGCFVRLCFEARGIPHEIILSGDFNSEVDLERLKNDTQKICEAEIDMFEGKASFNYYLFLLHVSDDVYGGLEHQTSTALLASRDCLPTKRMQAPTDEYVQLLGLISHEYFHAWNVKSIKPELFVDYDLDKEVYTEQLWAFEGITSYYDDLILLKSGLIDKEKYLTILAQNITKVGRGNGRTKQTLTDSSFNAWTKYYKQDENSVNSIVSYYQKGALFALCLDLLIRKETKQEKSLADLMRHFYHSYLETGEGIPEKMWQVEAEKYLGLDLSKLFDLGLYTVQDLPLKDSLKQVGLDYYWISQEPDSFGGFQFYPPTDNKECLDLGMKYQISNLGLKIQQVFDYGSAQIAGLSVGDELVAIDHLKITNIKKQLQYYKSKQEIIIHFFRRGVLKTCTLRLENTLPNTCVLVADRLDDVEWLKQ